jgi:hypothetical protein
MRSSGRILVILASMASAATLFAGQVSGTPRSPVMPEAYGVSGYTVISLPVTSLSPADGSQVYAADGTDYFRYFPSGAGVLVGGVIVPAGAVIDFVGIGSCDVNGGAFAARLFKRDVAGGTAYQMIAEFATSVHNGGTPCAMDYNANALGYLVTGNSGATLQPVVEQLSGSPTDGTARVGSVEVWYRLTVSPAPSSPSFNDVPVSHPYFQFIEALKSAGITGGCGGGNYCPDAPVTRAQIAAMLAKALGLHWPG